MGLTIGQFSGGGTISRTVRDVQIPRVSRPGQSAVQPGVQGRDESLRALLSQTDRIQANDGVITGGPAAALNTLNDTIEGVRESLPTLEEIRAEFRQKSEEARLRIQDQFQVTSFQSEEPETVEDIGLPASRESAQAERTDTPETSSPRFDSPEESSDNGADLPVREHEDAAQDDTGRFAQFNATA